VTRKRKAPTPKGKGRRGGRPVADRLAVHPVSMADQAAIKDELVANAAFQVEAFPQLQADLLTLFRRVHPLHLIAIVGQYGLFAPVSNQGIADGTLMEGIQQHHVELMQAFALALSDAEWGVSPATPKDVEQAVDTVKALADAFHARRFLEAENVEEKSERYRLMLREKIRLHTQMIRNWGHFGQVVDITRRLYLPLDPLLREAHGFAGTELISVAKAMLDLHQKRSSARFQQLQRVFAEQTVRGAVSRYYALFMPSEDPAPFLAMLPAEWPLDTVRQRLLAHADTQLARQASYAPDDLAATTGLPAGVVNAVLGALAFAPGALASMDREHLFLGNPVWTVPAIDLGSDYFVPAPQSIFSFIHAIMRRLATTPELKKALERRRAEFLETELAELLAEALPGAQVQSDIAWSLDGRRYQTDVVAKLDRVVVIAEAKSAALTEAALRGAPERVRKHVGELIVEPSQQSLRLAGLIERASGGDADARAILTPFGDDFFDVDEVVRLSVTLDDFSIIASSEPELRLAGWLPEDVPLGCTMGIADLAAVVEILGDPARIIHYLAERQRIQKTLQILGDEMDFLGFYLETGFNIAAIERNRPRLSISGMSAEIDRWFINREIGRMQPPPRFAIDHYFAKVMDAVRRHGEPGWLTITLDLLRAFDCDEQAEVVKSLGQLRKEAIRRRNDRERTATLLVTPPANRRTAILFHVYPQEYAAERHQLGAKLGAWALETSGRHRCLMIGRDTSRWHEPYSYIGFAEA
jgi:hypothetical protein